MTILEIDANQQFNQQATTLNQQVNMASCFATDFFSTLTIQATDIFMDMHQAIVFNKQFKVVWSYFLI